MIECLYRRYHHTLGAARHESVEKQRDKAWRFKNLADFWLPNPADWVFSEQLTRLERDAGGN